MEMKIKANIMPCKMEHLPRYLVHLYINLQNKVNQVAIFKRVESKFLLRLLKSSCKNSFLGYHNHLTFRKLPAPIISLMPFS